VTRSAAAATFAGRVLRLSAGAPLAACVVWAVAAPELPVPCKAAALLIAAAAAWQPLWGLTLLTMLTPAGALFAAAPARAAELFAWSFIAAWLLSIWRPLSKAGWPRTVILPLALFSAALVASWLSLTIAGAAGVIPSALPRFLAGAIAGNHLVVSSPEAETWTLLQTLGGLGVFVAATAVARSDPRTVRWVGLSLVASMTILAAATLVQLRDISGDRFSLPLADVNAAGSLYALAAVIALGYAWFQPARRLVWLPMLGLLASAVWLTGSRSAFLAVAAGAAALAAARRRWQPTRGHLIVGACVFLAAILAAGVFVSPQSEVEGSAGQSVNLRSQFLLTSARMFASAPVFGVGVGRYFGRSAEFMTPELRELYGNENAHNYFAQQFAELGLVGGLLFVWLVAAVLSQGWRAVLQSPDDIALRALFAGAAAYVLTCATGHPLLVPEAALPFWAASGAASATAGAAAIAKPWRALAIAAALVLATGIGRAAIDYARPQVQPPEQGFHQFETTPDGTEFRWMTRHAVTYIPDGPGFLHLRLRAPGWPAPHPVVIETSIGGQVVDRHEVRPDQSTTWDVPARDTRNAGRSGFRRVDFRVNQEWFEEVRLGRRTARRPVSVIVERIDWMPLR
jgi:O-antigen ligase